MSEGLEKTPQIRRVRRNQETVSFSAPPGILKRVKAEKRARKSVEFIDSIGKPLVECIEVGRIVYDEDLRNDTKYRVTDGRFIKRESFEWRMIEVHAPLRKIQNGALSVSYLAELKRRKEQGISSAALFGEFEAIDDPTLEVLSLLPQEEPILAIPVEKGSAIMKGNEIRQLPLPGTQKEHVYQQIFEEEAEGDDESKLTPELRNMLDQLRKRGFLTSEKTDEEEPKEHSRAQLEASKPAYPVRSIERNGYSRNKQKMCIFFVSKPGGCTKGDSCRFLHDEQAREKRLRDPKKRNESWR